MFNFITKIRNNDLQILANHLSTQLESMEQKWDGIYNFRLHGKNKKFIKHLLSRICSYIDNLAGISSTYQNYFYPEGKPFEIEHIWADKFKDHQDEFKQEHEFKNRRNSIGALLLLPRGTNESLGDKPYEEKLQYYIRENIYAQTLHCNFYQNNPNFLNNDILMKIKFEPHNHFKTKDIEKRLGIVQRICKELWSLDYFTKCINEISR